MCQRADIMPLSCQVAADPRCTCISFYSHWILHHSTLLLLECSYFLFGQFCAVNSFRYQFQQNFYLPTQSSNVCFLTALLFYLLVFLNHTTLNSCRNLFSKVPPFINLSASNIASLNLIHISASQVAWIVQSGLMWGAIVHLAATRAGIGIQLRFNIICVGYAKASVNRSG